MPSPIGHSMMGIAVYIATVRSSKWLSRWNRLLLLVLFSAGADLDYIPALFGGLEFANNLHRGISHTILFGVAAATLYLLIARATTRKLMWSSALVLLAAYLMHLSLDIFTDDGKPPYGIPIFHPFSNFHVYARYSIFPQIAKHSYADIFSLHNVKVALFEIAFFGIMILGIAVTRLFIERCWSKYA